ncbi:procollagen-lysine,2-oxoglutarate 5-dioxygenase isoform X1 [Nymphalis io]|uniref:procollagen-lysine,2-oxoglutarate 5-dioxygenase isoform X1 n=1 Tax=Inachis io TaxID=171585 RepID=UPI002168E762|nr:procollagen-lysine,2-oxoglutarate 5-dioxygenase isoform X1 [Nymphalis io]
MRPTQQLLPAIGFSWAIVFVYVSLLSPVKCDYCEEHENRFCDILREYIEGPEVLVFTVATESNHGLERYLRSAEKYGINVEVLGMGQKWEGGNMESPGGGQKVNLLREKLESIQLNTKSKEPIILFTDSHDIMFLGKIDEIVERFKKTNRRVLFSAEPFCWPDLKLAKQYPNSSSSNPFLNSGAFIGYLQEILQILVTNKINNHDDDQLYYTKIYIQEKYRRKFDIGLDSKCTLFLNLNGALSDVELVVNSTEDWPYIRNKAFNERPLIVHGNGPSKLMLNHFSNYLAKSWSVKEGCVMCKEKRIELKEDALPVVMLSVFIEQPTPFLEEFLQQIDEIDYPKDKIHLFMHNNVEYHEAEVDRYFQAHSNQYFTAKRITPSDYQSEAEARDIAKNRCANTACDYLFSIDSVARVGPSTLRYLLSTGYDIVAPMLVRPGQAWSNFWGAINSQGYYARSSDYMEIINGNRIGIWNVPFITNCYLMKILIFRDKSDKEVSHIMDGIDPDMAFCASLRKQGYMMYVSNEKELGHLVNPDTLDISRKNPDIYQVLDNKIEWEQRYLSPEYADNFAENRKHLMPCPDVYWFPIMSPRFCAEWIEVMEDFGEWSDGSNMDQRLEGGYEAVPTRDIHMKQVGLDKQWLYILKEYVRPLQEMVFTGYYHNPPVSVMNFVVRYRPNEQPSLRPHHDSSTYTINIALNTPNKDFEGGGCNFIRYNCSVKDTKLGWMLMHPGRLTHFHEGLRVTKGTRYIMISFVDP